MQDREIAVLVGRLTTIAKDCASTQQLRQRISDELVPYLKADQEEINNGSEWFNEYQKIDDFLLGKLEKDFPTGGKSAYINTIAAIEVYVDNKSK